MKFNACFRAGDYSAALDGSRGPEPLPSTPSSLVKEEYHFCAALCRAAPVGLGNTENGSRHAEALAAHRAGIVVCASRRPENFENQAALVAAEAARVEGRELEAERLYEHAIRSARANGLLNNEAHASELAARFHASRGLETIANAYLREARACYRRCGADSKVQQLDRLHPHLAALARWHPAAVIGSSLGPVDVASVFEASQTLFSEIEWPKSIERLMTIAVQNAGASRGLLILPSGDEYLVQAEARATDDQIEVTIRQQPITRFACPETLVSHVIRTRESVILDDASKPNPFSADVYLRDRQSKSVLCLPLMRQQQLAGLLLLENTRTAHAFTPARIAILELLAAHAAISLENARRYSDLQEREAKVRRLVDSNIIGICVFDLDGRIVEANAAFLRIVGYGHDELISGRLLWTALTPREWSGVDERALAKLAVTGACNPVEKEYFRKDGSRAPVLLACATYNEHGRQGIAFVLDLTDRQRAEAELAHANRVATMGQLTASIAHEVNQPIAALLMNAENAMRWLADQPSNSEKARSLIGRIISDGKRAADIVSRIREFSKKSAAQKGELEINEAILQIVTLTRAAMSEHGVMLTMQLSEGLPPILGDRVQLQQVILNLILNAIEALSEVGEGSRTLLISSSKAESGEVLVAVSDSGPGLPPTNLERIFEAFYTTKASGLGMGLSICRSIVEAHGGRLWGTPREPRGAAFRMMLPIGQ